MPSARIYRGFVSLAASAITAVYAAGYLHTQAADSALDPPALVQVTDSPVPVSATTPLLTDPAVGPTARATSFVITDGAVEVYADQHHVGWDQARAQLVAAGGIQQTASPTSLPTAIATATSPPLGSAATSAGGLETRRPALQATVEPAAASRPSQASAPPATATPVPRVAPVVPTATPKAVASGFKDGTFTGLGTSRRGNIKVSLVVPGGQIASVTITGSTTEYPTRDIARLQTEVVSRQSAQVDTVSGATYSSLAFRAAVQRALQSAKG